MIDMTCNIIPYIGIGEIKLGMSIELVRNFLKNRHTEFDQWVEPNKGMVPEIPWTFIRIENSIVLAFAEDILFEIYLENKYRGKLPNGISIDMKMTDAKQIDQTLEYNDDEEDFVSKDGYWLGDLVDTGKVISITIFLPEVEKDDFFEYNWVKKYKE